MHDIFLTSLLLKSFFDDIAVFTDGSYEEHLIKVCKCFSILEAKGFTIKPTKCTWCKNEVDYLGYTLQIDGIKPQTRKIDTLLKMEPPKNRKQLHSFLGMVNYYKIMWPRRAHILKPLTDISGKNKFKWEASQDQAFKEIKALISEDVMLCLPDIAKPFHLFTDASDYQLRSTIIQEGKPIAFYSRKLNPTQQCYSTIDKELLSYSRSDRVYRWKLAIQEFHPAYKYIKGGFNSTRQSH